MADIILKVNHVYKMGSKITNRFKFQVSDG